MDVKTQFNKLLSKKMSREGFIKHVAIGAVVVVGGGALLRLTSVKSGDAGTHFTVAYGGAPYGGSETSDRGRA